MSTSLLGLISGETGTVAVSIRGARSPIAERLTLLANPGKLEIENDTSVVHLPAPQRLIAEWDAIVRYSGSHPLPKFFDTP
jgi:hypothetical protein